MKELNQRERAFCVHLTTIGSETFGDGTKAAIAAGYSDKSAHVAASRLQKREKVRNRVAELHSENMQRNMITVDKVLADLEHDKIMARKHQQYAVAKSCTELQGKYLAMFTDKVQTNDAKTAEVKENERAEAEALAAERVQWKLQQDYKHKGTG